MPLAWFVYLRNYFSPGSSHSRYAKSFPYVLRNIHVHPRNDDEVFQPIEVLPFRLIHFVKYQFGLEVIDLRPYPLRVQPHLRKVDFSLFFGHVKKSRFLPLEFVNDTKEQDVEHRRNSNPAAS